MQTSVTPYRFVADMDAPNSGYCMVGKDETDTEIGVYFEFDALAVEGTITQVEVHAQWDNAYANGTSGQIVQPIEQGEYSTTDVFNIELYPHQSSPENLMKGFSTQLSVVATYEPAAGGPACRVKVDGTWRPVARAKVKSGGAWHDATGKALYGGTWHAW